MVGPRPVAHLKRREPRDSAAAPRPGMRWNEYRRLLQKPQIATVFAKRFGKHCQTIPHGRSGVAGRLLAGDLACYDSGSGYACGMAAPFAGRFPVAR